MVGVDSQFEGPEISQGFLSFPMDYERSIPTVLISGVLSISENRLTSMIKQPKDHMSLCVFAFLYEATPLIKNSGGIQSIATLSVELMTSKPLVGPTPPRLSGLYSSLTMLDPKSDRLA